MGKSNFTIWELIKDKNPKYMIQECMMHIANCTSDFKIIIPHEWLNDKLIKEDVYRWLEIGNKTLFPAKIREITISEKDTKLSVGACRMNGIYYGLNVEPRKLNQREKYRSSDVLSMPLGAIRSFSVSIEELKSSSYRSIGFNVSSNRLKVRSIGGLIDLNNSSDTWGAHVDDLCMYGTDELLKDYVLRTYDELSNRGWRALPAYEVTIDCKNVISKTHRLSILSFYRYLYSSRYPDVVYNALRLVSIGIDPWEALYASLSKINGNYYNYYSLLSAPGFKSIEKVSKDLKIYDSVNKSFSIDRHDKHLYVDLSGSEENIIENVNNFVEKSLTGAKAEDKFRFICINASKTLTNNKVYTSACLSYDKKKNFLCGDDYKYRYYSSSRFKQVK